jgi:hypothetical protein
VYCQKNNCNIYIQAEQNHSPVLLFSQEIAVHWPKPNLRSKRFYQAPFHKGTVLILHMETIIINFYSTDSSQHERINEMCTSFCVNQLFQRIWCSGIVILSIDWYIPTLTFYINRFDHKHWHVFFLKGPLYLRKFFHFYIS